MALLCVNSISSHAMLRPCLQQIYAPAEAIERGAGRAHAENNPKMGHAQTLEVHIAAFKLEPVSFCQIVPMIHIAR